jgi:hypothetical protein
MWLEEVVGDIATADSTFIAHQANCTTSNGCAKGVAKRIFKVFPDSNTYSSDTRRVLGEISVHERVINMYAQQRGGKPRSRRERDARHVVFQKCLSEISKLCTPDESTLSVPYGIGCGLAGGAWEIYRAMLESFAVAHRIKVYLYKLE